MKQKKASHIIADILIGFIIAVLVVAAGAFLALKFVVLPHYAERFEDEGRVELAEVVKNNNNLGAFASIGKLLSNPDVMNFISSINRETASSVLDVLDTLDGEYDEGESASDGTWITGDSAVQSVLKRNEPAPPPAPEPVREPEKVITSKTPQTAYERIAAAATAEDMADGLKIISKLDVGYVSSLTEGGLTEGEKNELSKYVHSVLSSSEISRALQLYRTYSKYL